LPPKGLQGVVRVASRSKTETAVEEVGFEHSLEDARDRSRTEAGVDVNATRSGSEEGKIGPERSVYFVDALTDAGIPQGDLANDQPETGGSGEADDD
jgi:hypothetical protein